MSDRGSRTEAPNDVELDVIRSFGWSIMEAEETLYQRFLHLSVKRSLMSRDDFTTILRNMESKGFVSPIHLQGLKGYQKLVVESNAMASLRPKDPLDEIRLVIGSKKAIPRIAKETPIKINGDLLEKSETIGKAIQTELESWMLRETGRISKGLVHEHMKNMCHALSESEESLFEYVRTQTPGILIEIGQILRLSGPDFLLLSLRVTESNVRKYSF
ncbi:MAG: hypothetical protein E4H14_19300 [Candidatus Thorarchaeota archaeon]|nr:MAG: hypothetical protein E4H14_19300 [Candidatus Thorarchaeota archaeon]